MTETELIPDETTGTLYSLGQITLAIFLGSPIAGCLLVAKNYRTLGKNEAALQSLLVGVILTPVLFSVAYLLPVNFPNTVLPVAYTVGMREGIRHLQGDAISKYMEAGRKGSWMVATLVGLGCLVLIAIFVFGLVFFLDISF
ncbi:MAG: hypothetical protein ACREO5_01925 [Candidatus Binatia bacterium]